MMNFRILNSGFLKALREERALDADVGSTSASMWVAIAIAMLVTCASLGIAAYVGWQSAAHPVERALRVLLVLIAGMYVHLLPIGWRTLSGRKRMGAFLLWMVALGVVMVGQVTFFIISQRHAGELRAATVVSTVDDLEVPPRPARSRLEVARDIEKAHADLSRLDISRCSKNCDALQKRVDQLNQRLKRLAIEDRGLQRWESTDDRRIEQQDRDRAERKSQLSDPVAGPLADWLGASEAEIQFWIGVATAVVLEGAGVVCWTFVSLIWSSRRTPSATLNGREPVECDRDVVAKADSDISQVAECLAEPNPDLVRIHEAVVAGKIKPTQRAIRDFIGCAQPKAGKLNRMYAACYGTMSG